MGTNGKMGSGGMMGGSGGMMCNMDSMMVVMKGMIKMNTFKMDSIMNLHMLNYPAIGTMSSSMKDLFNNIQAMRKEHMTLHK